MSMAVFYPTESVDAGEPVIDEFIPPTEKELSLPIAAPAGEWFFFGACREIEPHPGDHRVNVFIRKRGDTYGDTDKKTCAHCPVLADCRAFALANPCLYGTWGGTTLRERDAWRREHGVPPLPRLLDSPRKGTLQSRLVALRTSPDHWRDIMTFLGESGAPDAAAILGSKVRMVSPGHLEFSGGNLQGGSLLQGRYVPTITTIRLRVPRRAERVVSRDDRDFS